MNNTLLTAILLCTIGIGIYLLYMLFGHKKRKDDESSGIEIEGHRNEGAISDNPIYHETKEVVAALRSGLDDFQELVDVCFSSKTMSSEKKLKVACEESFPAMHVALGESRSATVKLLARVQPESSSEELEPISKPIAETLSAPPAETKSTPSKIERIDGLLKRVQVIVESVGPSIAHFYIALTLPDENERLQEAAIHASALVHHLDDSIYELKKMEELLLK